ncbi:UPF0489 family protein [uncultured Chitinophaga sp.]|jgi:hypothetical protein|uniref:UPF0489 family protein n=1 Tax=uncultured Chitinophaga sp. TaxID=339340 RepID=UPI00262D3A01|nr:UPF0489 family protein [uncultured Chitinophaga sp.]
MQTKIPTFILEEHNEAFYTWCYCVHNKLIAANGNTLIHVDEHSDMGIPRFNTSVKDAWADLVAAEVFTRNEVGIATFMFPAIYQGLFDKVYWIKQEHRKKKDLSRKMYVRSYNSEGRKLIGGEVTPVILRAKEYPESDVHIFGYYLRTIEGLPAAGNVALDIDLDYFSCSGNPNELEELFIEVTLSEYEKFMRDPYHRIRYMGCKAEAIQRAGKYYLVLNNYREVYPDVYPFSLKVDDAAIAQRMTLFFRKLSEKKLRPSVITICRSRYSGYTPHDQWRKIEDTLISGLKDMYELEITPIGELIAKGAGIAQESYTEAY